MIPCPLLVIDQSNGSCSAPVAMHSSNICRAQDADGDSKDMHTVCMVTMQHTSPQVGHGVNTNIIQVIEETMSSLLIHVWQGYCTVLY
jgi:hypothetical protein